MTASYDRFDEALEVLAGYGPDLSNGLTSHAPMAVEALCALGREDAVMPWIERYRRGMLPRPAARARIAADEWRATLGRLDRIGDWNDYFAEELQNAPWQGVLNTWTDRLAPAFSASATHGVIRVGHVVRSLSQAETQPRVRELGDALAYWAANYEELPTNPQAAERRLGGFEAIEQVSVVPPELRRFEGTITSSMAALADHRPFADVIGLLDSSGDLLPKIDVLTEVFARVYLANTHDVLTAIVFVHGVTSVAALAHLLPYLDDSVARRALRFAWQSSCGLYAAFGSRPKPASEIEPAADQVAVLIDRAVTHGDEHAIKFTEACLQRHDRHPSAAYLAAIDNALVTLPRAA